MSDINEQIEKRIQAFVTELSGLVRAAAMSAVSDALGGGGSSVSHARPSAPRAKARRAAPTPAAAAPAAKAAAKAPAKAKASKGGRRTPEQIAASVASVLGYIKANPNTKSEAIRKALKLPRSLMRDALDRLGEAKKIKMKGVKRAASYSAA